MAAAPERIAACVKAGGRIDWELAGQAHLTVQGDVNSGRMGLADRPDIKMDGGNVVVTYTKPIGAGEVVSNTGLRRSRASRRAAGRAGKPARLTTSRGSTAFDWRRRYQLLWGGGVRSTLSDTQTDGPDFLRARAIARSTRCTDSRRPRSP